MNISSSLLLQARQGDETAQAAVIAHLMPRIRRIASANLVPGLDREDAEQEGLIALFRAVVRYDPASGASFDTYATRCIANGIADARQNAQRKKHQPLNQSVPLEDTASSPGPEQQAVEKEQYHATVRILRTRLSPVERSVLLLRLDGNDYRTIARKLDVSVKTVDNALVRIRTKLKNRRDT